MVKNMVTYIFPGKVTFCEFEKEGLCYQYKEVQKVLFGKESLYLKYQRPMAGSFISEIAPEYQSTYFNSLFLKKRIRKLTSTGKIERTSVGLIRIKEELVGELNFPYLTVSKINKHSCSLNN